MSAAPAGDPDRWLEGAGEDVRAWERERDEQARELLHGWPGLDRVRKRVTPHALACGVVAPRRRGALWFRVVASAGGRGSALVAGETPDALDRTLVDTAQLDGSAASLDWYEPSPDGAHVAYGVSFGGDEQSVLRVVETGSGRVLPLEVPHASFGAVAWLPDGRSFLHSAGLAADTAWPQKHLFHRRLDATVAPRPEVLHPSAAYVRPQVSPTGRYAAAVVGETRPRPEFVRDLAGDGLWRPFLRGVTGTFAGVLLDDAYVAVTDDGAPRGRLVSIPLATPTERDTWTELVPESERVLRFVARAGPRLLLGELQDTCARLRLVHGDGSPLADVPLPGDGAVGLAAGWGLGPLDAMADATGDEVSFVFHAPAQPPAAYRYEIATRRLHALDPPPPPLPGAVVQRGTTACERAVRYWLVRRRDAASPGPTLVYGYGGWNVAVVPAYLGPLAAFVEAGGTVVLAQLRGGGELGEEHFEAGRLARKQGTFDDLFALADHLVAQGVAGPAQLAVAGASNGGLLAAAAVSQRPDLFGAVVSLVPLGDMLRFGREAYPATFAEDYGDPADLAAAAVLRAYSPVHRLAPGRAYPPVLAVASANDVRCPPWHARKLVAGLERAGARTALLRVWPDAGHLLATADHPEFSAEWLSFVHRHLGLEPSEP